MLQFQSNVKLKTSCILPIVLFSPINIQLISKYRQFPPQKHKILIPLGMLERIFMLKKYLKMVFTCLVLFSTQIVSIEDESHDENTLKIPQDLKRKIMGSAKIKTVTHQISKFITNFRLDHPEVSFESIEDIFLSDSDIANNLKKKSLVTGILNDLKPLRSPTCAACIDHFRKYLVGQNNGIKHLTSAVMRLFDAMEEHTAYEPISVFLTGPSGSGKTATFEALKPLLVCKAFLYLEQI